MELKLLDEDPQRDKGGRRLELELSPPPPPPPEWFKLGVPEIDSLEVEAAAASPPTSWLRRRLAIPLPTASSSHSEVLLLMEGLGDGEGREAMSTFIPSSITMSSPHRFRTPSGGEGDSAAVSVVDGGGGVGLLDE